MKVPGPASVIAALSLAVSMSLLSLTVMRVIEPARIGPSQFFQSDLGRVFSSLTDRWSPLQDRSVVHPLFAILDAPFVYFIRSALRVDSRIAVTIWMVLLAALWSVALFAAARAIRLPVIDAVLVVLLAGTSAAGLIWLSVPETFAASSVTLLCVIALAGRADDHRISDLGLTAATVTSLAITVTNVMAGVVLALRTRPPHRAIQIVANGVVIVFLLQVVQNVWFPATHFMLERMGIERRYVMPEVSGGVREKGAVLLTHSVVMPAVSTQRDMDTKGLVVSFQPSAVGSGGVVGWMATIGWWALLGWGAWSALLLCRQSVGVSVLGLTVLGQLGLHVFYGDETFLYGLNYVPLLVLLAGIGLLGARRHLVRAAFVVVIGLTALNNAAQFPAVIRMLNFVLAANAQ